MTMPYQHPPAFKVLKADIRLGPYAVGECFSADELNAAEGESMMADGILEGIDAFGDPFVHPLEAMAFDEVAPDEEPVEEPTGPAAE